MEEYFLHIIYRDKKIMFKVVNPALHLGQLMHNVQHAVGGDGRLVFDFPSLDHTGAPMDYFFAKEDPMSHEIRILMPRIGKNDQGLEDYNVHNGDSLHIIPDPFPG